MSCSSDDQSDKECPLCMEQLEIDDIDFYPCKCEYQICRFCWHRLRTDENGLCPACRQPYPENPVNFKPLSSADVQRHKDEKRMKVQAEKLKVSESRKHLANYRVLQKNLVYVVGLSPRFAESDLLKKPEYFGRFGKIQKVVVGSAPAALYPHLQSSHTAYVTYSKVEEALRAIQGVNNAMLDGRMVKASLGTTKYCSSFLRSQKCYKAECMYLHDIADRDISFTKEDMHAGKHAEYERRLIDSVLNKHVYSERNSAGLYPKQKYANVSWETNGKSNDVSSDTNSTGEIEESKPLDAVEVDKHEDTKCENENVEVEDPKDAQDSSTSSSAADDVAAMEPLSLSLDETKMFRFLNNDDEGGVVPAPAPIVDAPAPLMNWQTLLGLTPPSQVNGVSNSKPMLSSPPGLNGFGSDDDLGFDPFSESSKGLAKLLEEERTTERHTTFTTANLHELWGRPPQPMHHHQPMPPQNHFGSLGLGSLCLSGGGGPMAPSYGYPHERNVDLYAPPGLSGMRSQRTAPQTMSEWQEGLKALLPNVNVRFADELSSSSRWPLDMSSPPQMLPHSIPPPPGFTVPNR